MTFLFAFDSFKGCLSAAEACAAAASGLPSGDKSRIVPLSDGGEGVSRILADATGGRMVPVRVTGPLGEERMAEYGLSGDGATAFVEVAAASGLALVPSPLRNPMRTTSHGTGELLRAALEAGAKRLVLGLGGSATNDAGLGLLQALGFRLLDAAGRVLPVGATGADLSRVADIVPPDGGFPQVSLTVPCDVRAPLHGRGGAAHVFAPQKGASPEDVERLDAGLRHIGEIFDRLAPDGGEPPSRMAGGGAAGGVGACVAALLGGRLVPGIEFALDAVRFDEALRGADWVVTGEGHSDAQTLMGKVPQGVARRAHAADVPVALLSGGLADEEVLRTVFDHVASINPPGSPLSESLRPDVARCRLAEAVGRLAGLRLRK